MLLIYNGKIVTMTETDFEKGYVLIDNGKIKAVGQDINEAAGILNTDVQKIDAQGGYVLPGLIDAHSHIGMWEDAVGFEGDDGNESTDPVMPHLRAIDAVYHADRSFVEAYENGVTTVITGPGSANVIGGQFAALKTYGRYVDEMLLKQPVAMKVAFGENPKTIYNEKHQAPMTRMATAAILRESLFEAKEYRERLNNFKSNPDEYEKPDFDFKKEALVQVLDKEIPLKAHAHRADDIMTAIRIAKEFDVGITLDHCTEGHLIKEALAEAGLPVIVGPMITDRSKIELRNQNLKTPGILSKLGIKVAIMTDHPCVPQHYLCLCAAIAAREGMDEREAMKAITINAAEITGINDRVGSIETGKDADIVIYDGNPFELKTRVQKTIINGIVVYERV
ncbi:imidazolonepropionase-like amidohydrolase [Ruminiclostridium sufflavum DSM 19573]|uniref:Imidazolonepropionase-like amidohydrolase n=1 Tax=Ruminiclostridium sufflavum DSM 19573 TaxID=1121337 RepID=A0A318XTM7_9FIRM|nr:amidohydrolase [Ruminiclostridium sufflavum]PYG85692.1 imidazolonepropionase-like amidohydrolase [Ruminiclostridium sufflavum DSM 19573]